MVEGRWRKPDKEFFQEPEMIKSLTLHDCVSWPLGKPTSSKTDEFSEKFQRGGGSFPIQKFLLQILDFWTGFFWHKNDTKGYFQGMFLSQPLPGWFVAPIFRRNDHVQTGICMILPENRCHRVPVWVRGGGGPMAIWAMPKWTAIFLWWCFPRVSQENFFF